MTTSSCSPCLPAKQSSCRSPFEACASPPLEKSPERESCWCWKRTAAQRHSYPAAGIPSAKSSSVGPDLHLTGIWQFSIGVNPPQAGDGTVRSSALNIRCLKKITSQSSATQFVEHQRCREAPVVFVAAVFAGGEAAGGFSLGAGGSSSVGAVSGVSTLMWCSPACCSSGTTLLKSIRGVPATAPCMNSSQMGSAARAPVSFFPSEICLSSKPTHTPAVSCGVNPTNQASV